MKAGTWPLWLKLATGFDVLIMLISGGFGSIWLWGMLPYAPPHVDRVSVLAKQVGLYVGLPLAAVAVLAISAYFLERRRLPILAYILMTLPLFAAPTLFWESMR